MARAPIVATSARQRHWPADDAAPAGRPIRRWHVLHTCEEIGRTASLAEAQIQAGMRPSVLTVEGWYGSGETSGASAATALSLVHEWQRVRRWRNRLALENAEQWAEILHAHGFAAGMAGLRTNLPVVYDMVRPIGAAVTPKPGAWLLRSLRVAEQFVLSRAEAVVVHSQAAWGDALKRGTTTEELFLVPHPVELAEMDAGGSGGITLFAPDVLAPNSSPNLSTVLQAFALLATEVENVRLLVEAGPGQEAEVRADARKKDVAGQVEVIAPAARKAAMATADIVVCGAALDEEPNATVISALAHGRALLAADLPLNREVTPQGRGCLWYRPEDAHDLAGRAAFLARNRDFRVALGISGREHVRSTRGPLVVARKYDEVYRYASQRKRRGPTDLLHKLEVAQARL